MAKKTYIGVNGVSRQVKNIYIGVNNIARKVKKAYIGIANIARQFFGGGELSYYGTATPLPNALTGASGGYVDNYALIAGGLLYNSYGGTTPNIYTYNQNLTQSTASNLTTSLYNVGSSHVEEYAIFAGGNPYTDTFYSSSVAACNNNLITTSCDTLTYRAQLLSGCHVGNYAMFGAGERYERSLQYWIDIYNNNLTHSTKNTGSTYKLIQSTSNTPHYVLMPTAYSFNAQVPTVYSTYAFNSNLTQTTTPNNIGNDVYNYSSNVNNYSIFVTYGTNQPKIYDDNLSLISTTSTLPLGTYPIIGNPLHDGAYAIFAGGYYQNDAFNIMYVFDESLVLTTLQLSVARGGTAGTFIGNYILFAGGNNNNGMTNIVDVYTT